MTQIGSTYYELKEMAKTLEKEGICNVYDVNGWSDEEGFSVEWVIEHGDEFVKASAFAHKVAEWAETIDGDETDAVTIYSVEDTRNDMQYLIRISPVWL